MRLADVVKKLAADRQNTALGTHTVFAEPKGDEPIYTALSVIQIGNLFSCVEFKIQGERVLSVDIDDPNAKQIAADCFKISAQKKFLD